MHFIIYMTHFKSDKILFILIRPVTDVVKLYLNQETNTWPPARSSGFDSCFRLNIFSWNINDVSLGHYTYYIISQHDRCKSSWVSNQVLKTQHKAILLVRRRNTYGANVVRWGGGFTHKLQEEYFKLLQHLNLDGIGQMVAD